MFTQNVDTPTPTATTEPTLTPTVTLTPTLPISYIATLDSGQPYQIDRSATFGDVAIVIGMLLITSLLTILIIMEILNARVKS
jgi:hypothetical protein